MFRPLHSINYIVIHHSAADLSIAGLKAEYAIRGAGYNFAIDDSGSLTDGLAQAVELLPMTTVSNGTYGLNFKAWNICLDGNFEVTPIAKEHDRVKTLIQVLAVKAKKLGWRKRDVARIISHQYAGRYLSRTRYGTACPGRNLINLLPFIRFRVAAYLPV